MILDITDFLVVKRLNFRPVAWMLPAPGVTGTVFHFHSPPTVEVMSRWIGEIFLVAFNPQRWGDQPTVNLAEFLWDYVFGESSWSALVDWFCWHFSK